jgi:inward rectifier potassium channel
MAKRGESWRPNGDQVSYSLRVVGGRSLGMNDAYHALLRMPWWRALGLVVAAFLLFNLLFAGLYLWFGGIAHARPGSLEDAFFFSVQTMATIGYGDMHPMSEAANVLMVLEAVVGLLLTALSTGLVFARFSRLRGRVVFSKKVAYGPMEGVPTLQIRVGNERSNRIYNADFQLLLTRTTRTAEGVTFYRTEDLKLVRDRAHSLSRSWTLLHPVTRDSPLFGHTPESLAGMDAELVVALNGVDDTTLQPIRARYTWEHPDISWGARLSDILFEDETGMTLDLTRFHDLSATQPLEGFPYPRPEAKP